MRLVVEADNTQYFLAEAKIQVTRVLENATASHDNLDALRQAIRLICCAYAKLESNYAKTNP